MELTQEIVRELLDYDPDTGKLLWKERDVKWFVSSGKNTSLGNSIRWNSKFSRKEAFKNESFKGYKVGKIFHKEYFSHRIIWLWMTGNWPKEQIDHIDGNKKNNVFSNLREVSNSENAKNRKIPINNTSGKIGVFKKSDGSFQAYIKLSGKVKHLGFGNFEEASNLRDEAELHFNFHTNHGKR